ncbi:unnamed protein product, partial [Mesorhabditis belari]|uniref:Uncharacterized protein n=1 Tax=Mesorhabditis belari TaxID=2138241 RepID=A0AAF3J757_9BILA
MATPSHNPPRTNIGSLCRPTITIICDTPLILLIFVNQHLRCQKELIIIAFMCVADTVHSIACLLSAIYRLWIAVNDLGLPEKLIAVMKPVYYRSLSPRFSFGVMGGLFIYITTTISFFLVIIYSNPPFLTSAYCFSEAFTPGIWKYMLYFRLSTLVISSLLYTPISARIYKMSKTLKGGISNINKGNYSKRLIRTTMTIGL